MLRPNFFILASLLCLGLSLALAPRAQAQAKADQTPGTAATQSTAAPYLLGPADIINIDVSNFPELSIPQLSIPSDGKVSVQFVDGLPITGMTTTELAQILTQKWAEYVIKPAVTVTLVQKRKEDVLLYGHVAHPQTVEWKPDLRLSQALAQVGGGADDGDMSKVTLTHKDGTKQTLDLNSPKSTDGDLVLALGDVVYVPESNEKISVLGEVGKPGSYAYKAQMTVLEALQAAGGLGDDADLAHARLLHDGKEITLDLKALPEKDDSANNIMLSSGDQLFIPELHNRVYVGGAVTKQGYYKFNYGDRIQDALNSAGIIIGISDLTKIQVFHQDKKKNTATVQTVNFQKFYSEGNPAVNLLLSPDDVIYVPRKKYIPFSKGPGDFGDPIRFLGL